MNPASYLAANLGSVDDALVVFDNVKRVTIEKELGDTLISIHLNNGLHLRFSSRYSNDSEEGLFLVNYWEHLS